MTGIGCLGARSDRRPPLSVRFAWQQGFVDRSPDIFNGGLVESSCVDHQSLANPSRTGRFQSASRQTAPTGLRVWSIRSNDENRVDASRG